jgi:hypothetical protein
MSVELDAFGLQVKDLVESEIRELGQTGCKWKVKQDREVRGPLVTIWAGTGRTEFQIDYEEQVALQDHQLSSLVHDHVRRAFNHE